MNIPIQNIYYLLCYSWDKLAEKDIVNVDATTCTNVVDLFAKVLINGCVHLFKKGLDRSYVVVSGPVNGVKGKVNFEASIKQNLFSKAQAFCAYDEFDYNVLHNQILKSTIAHLVKTKGINPDLKNQLILIHRKFHGIDSIRVTSQCFNKIVLHRNNFFYDFLLKICQIIHDDILVTEEIGKYKFKDFVRDEARMRMLFENFVFNFYKKELLHYKTRREIINWDAIALENSAIDLLPLMKTDICLESASRKIVIDTKYYAQTLITNYNKDKIRSSNLYQLFAYLKNIEAKGGINVGCEGILLYPTIKQELDEKYQLGNHKVSIKTINLNQAWQDIHLKLLDIVN